MPNPTEAERMVWKWQEQFRYKLNIPDDKIEELQQQVTTALLVARQAQIRELVEHCRGRCTCIKVGDIVAEQCEACKFATAILAQETR